MNWVLKKSLLYAKPRKGQPKSTLLGPKTQRTEDNSKVMEEDNLPYREWE